jgi:hypothetical protein
LIGIVPVGIDWIETTPLRPASNASQSACRVQPSGVTTPQPVITTRRDFNRNDPKDLGPIDKA